MHNHELKKLRRSLPHNSYNEIRKRMKAQGVDISYSAIAQIMIGTWVNNDVLNHAIDIANEYYKEQQSTSNRVAKMKPVKSN